MSIIPSCAAGEDIEWEADNIESLCNDLITEGFSQVAVDSIHTSLQKYFNKA
jgi:hypothetical protein